MTNRIKTVQKPKVIMVCCRDSERISEIISDILNFCSFNSSINDFSENTDFVIETDCCCETPDGDVIYDTAVFDGSSEIPEKKLSVFRSKVTDYENAMRIYGDDPEDVITFSEENYCADVACRNITAEDGNVSFDIIGNGILSRVSIVSGRYSIQEVLACTGALLSAGLPLASVLEYFRYEKS